MTLRRVAGANRKKNFDTHFRRLLACDGIRELLGLLPTYVRRAEAAGAPLDFVRLYWIYAAGANLWRPPGRSRCAGLANTSRSRRTTSNPKPYEPSSHRDPTGLRHRGEGWTAGQLPLAPEDLALLSRPGGGGSGFPDAARPDGRASGFAPALGRGSATARAVSHRRLANQAGPGTHFSPPRPIDSVSSPIPRVSL